MAKYENMTYEVILQRLLDRVPDTLDKREGSIIYDALAPAAAELAIAYAEHDIALDEAFADTASMEYLIKRTSERGVVPYPATASEIRGEFVPATVELEIGARFNGGTLNYAVSEKLSDGVYKLICETAGSEGDYTGILIPIDYIEGLQSASSTEITSHGTDGETEDELRKRYFESIDAQPFGGNVAAYKDAVKSLNLNIGGVKVLRAANGGGTVKIIITNSNFGEPEADTVTAAQSAIDPIRDGAGLGIAPIGHIVTISGVETTPIAITANIEYKRGHSWSSVSTTVTAYLSQYIASLAETWEDAETITVRLSQIQANLLDVEGIEDVSDVTINGNAGNLIITDYSVPVLESIMP